MNPSIVALQFIAGLIFLYFGGEFLVTGSSRAALVFKISPLIVGLTVISLGTSAPELAVSLEAAFRNNTSMALGNVIGSNLLNFLFILGLSALITPLKVNQQFIKREVPILLFATILTYLLALDGVLGRFDGLILSFMAFNYFLYIVRKGKKETKSVEKEYAEYLGDTKTTSHSLIKNIFLTILGMGILVLGSHFFINASVSLAQHFGISDLVIGLTVVALGTSLPEMAASITAAMKGERDIAVGNIIGSNILNIFVVLGVSSAIAKNGILVGPEALSFNYPFLILSSLLIYPIFVTDSEISRSDGLLLVFIYSFYTIYLILEAKGSPSLEYFKNIIFYFVAPAILSIVIIKYFLFMKKAKS